MQGQLSTLPPGGAGPALRLPLLHSYLLPLLRAHPGAVPAGACLNRAQGTPSSWFSHAATGHPPTSHSVSSGSPPGLSLTGVSSRVRETTDVLGLYPGVMPLASLGGCPLHMYMASSKAG